MFKEKLHLKEYHNESMEDTIKTGIYTIEFLNKPGIYYVGSATRTNMKFGKSNVGFNARWREHLLKLYNGNHYNKKLQNTFNKYGKENIRFEIIEFCEPNICHGIEQYWLNMLDSYRNGYNLAYVVDKHSIGYVCTPERRKQMSDRMLGEKNPCFKKDKKIKEKKERKIIKVLQYDFDGNFVKEYNSVKEATEFVHGSDGNISRVCRRNSVELSYKNHFWFYSTDNIDIQKYIIDTKNRIYDSKVSKLKKFRKPNDFKKVNQYDLDGIFIQEHNSIQEATISINGTNGNISNCCNGKSKTYKGFIWKHIKITNNNETY